MGPTFRIVKELKRDHFGTIELGVLTLSTGEVPAVRRHFGAAPLWSRPIAWLLARREALALTRLHDNPAVPRLLQRARGALIRSYLEGLPLHEAAPQGPAWFDAAKELLDRLHAAGVTHNDLHKEPNLLVRDDGSPALLDFQIAGIHRRRGRWFQLCVDEDHRHLLKHKRRYCAESLTDDERMALARPSFIARWWSLTGKRVYTAFTNAMGWRDREGRGRR